MNNTMYCRDNNGAIREWSIHRDEFDIVIRHGVMGGSMQEKRESVTEGKGGRDLDEQIMSMMASRIHRQLDKGYVNSVHRVGDKATNALGLHKPMLAQPLKNVKAIDFKDAFIQHKFDGNRCLVTKHKGEIIAYSRNGKRQMNIEHILDELRHQIFEGETFDGELYCHGQSLQTIVSWIKRKQENNIKVRYHIYDVITNSPYKERFARLEKLFKGRYFEVVPTYRVDSLEAVQSFYRAARAEKYEGAIVRWGSFGYEDGKRSKSLVKVKGWIDEEFVVMGIMPSKDGWARLKCYKDGNLFTVSAPGSMPEKYEVMENVDKYIGRPVRVEYAFLTKDGVPFHPVATDWRNKNEE